MSPSLLTDKSNAGVTRDEISNTATPPVHANDTNNDSADDNYSNADTGEREQSRSRGLFSLE